MTPDLRFALLSDTTSRMNKIWLAINNGAEWRWQGQPRRSRLEFLVDGQWKQARSFDEDIVPTLILNEQKK